MRRRIGPWIGRLPGMAALVRRLRGAKVSPFPGSAAYWQQRYAEGGTSGAGSYGKFARFKAGVINALFDELGIDTAIEFGCGDGNQLRLLTVREYVGVDVSAEAIAICRREFAGVPGRRFLLAAEAQREGDALRCEAALSLDVIYHLVEDAAFDSYMRRLFAAATRCVVVYSSNREGDAGDGAHVRHRRFTDWIEAHAPGWRLLRQVANAHPYRGDWREGSFADFYIYVPKSCTAGAP
jgi:SAM-dependent methyltransferase